MVKVHFQDCYLEAIRECKKTAPELPETDKLFEISTQQLMVCIYVLIESIFSEYGPSAKKVEGHIHVLHPEAYEELLTANRPSTHKQPSEDHTSKRQKTGSTPLLFSTGCSLQTLKFLRDSVHFSAMFDWIVENGNTERTYVIIPLCTKPDLLSKKQPMDDVNLVLLDLRDQEMIILDPNHDECAGENHSDKYSLSQLFSDDSCGGFYSSAKGGYKAHKCISRLFSFLVTCYNEGLTQSKQQLHVRYFGSGKIGVKKGVKLFQTLYHLRTFFRVVLHPGINTGVSPLDEVVDIIRETPSISLIKAILGGYKLVLNKTVLSIMKTNDLFTFAECNSDQANLGIPAGSTPFKIGMVNFNHAYCLSAYGLKQARAGLLSPSIRRANNKQ
ncbi:unnamed protein product [Ambrosiozyma monospora]|uniref:Unnamed protein product n=1 Tax=Ambrosiozyma monospora TaxID=43982 RepID=A0A9W6YTD6_AMBMO|nr:unnamed protein product [Ambrosiozyma monospora]